ncbi:4-hydroxy-tetrahydrodipicolinate reductase [Effusibacillus lacus]|uniref:4-hydroxy-tetrahydrodipicolinate reductase n=1 Tax=Effusibacillus lacus TaxID=1348429 RepID=A0A292YMR0_9BACL|nr:4-hydroxy-tetrahydrodipicolinate reductase [Effusibacillus lacus]TCS75326.1 dihydrodipicolinate reductase [Effusibacillus lacus]GAX89760.1 4-hydroxy-tetrahydrodipicolinate reductase [Effusibacillus lacus]
MTEKGKVRVVVVGANGRMGREVVRTVVKDPGLQLVGAVDRSVEKEDVGVVLGLGETGVYFSDKLGETLLKSEADVIIDFTTPNVVRDNIYTSLEYGVRPVVGTTGIPQEDLQAWDRILQDKGIGGLVAPNFAIGAILMMKFAAQAARYLPHVEIIEMHHDQKLDAPSGTAIKTAEMIVKERQRMVQGHPDEEEKLAGARGADFEGMKIHSVRLPGYVAHQEVILGGIGQTLTIRHDSISRESFMPGVAMAAKKVMEFTGLVYGLENLID